MPGTSLTVIPGPDDPELFTRQQAARKLNVSRSTLIRMARAGLISEIRLTERSIRIRPQVIADYLAARETTRTGSGA